MNPDSPLSEDEDEREASSGRDKFRRERDDSPSPNRDGNGFIPLGGRMREGHGPMIPYDMPPQGMIPKGYGPPPSGPGGLLPTPVGPMGSSIPGAMDPAMVPYERSRSPERWVRDRYSSRSPPRRYDYPPSYRRYEGDRRRDYEREREREYYRREREWERDWEREREWDRERERERYRDRRDEYGRRYEEKPFHPREGDDQTPPYKRRRDDWDRRPSSMSPPPGFHSGPPVQSYRPPRSIRDMNHLYEGPLKTFKQFQETQDEYTQPGELEKRFEEYQQEYKRRQAMAFFNEHKIEEWFLEKYHPQQVEKARTHRAEQSRSNATNFFEELAEGNLSFSLTSLDGENVTSHSTEGVAAAPTATNGTEENGNAEGESGVLGEEEEGVIKQQPPEDTTTVIAVPSALVAKTGLLAGPDGNLLFSNTGPSMFGKTLFVKTVPPQWSKSALLELMGSVKDCPIVKAIFSEPNRFKGFHRLAWVSYETEQQAQKVLAEINGKKLHDHEVLLGLNKPMSLASEKPRKPRITTPVTSTEERLLVDLRQAQALTRKLDEEREIVNNPLFGKEFEERVLTTAERLDFFLVYLRQVHFYCYYCAEEFDDIDDLFRNCGAAHVRSNKQGVFAGTSIEKEWVTNLDNKINKRISDPSELTSPIGKDLVERIPDEFCDRQTKLIEEGKFACGLCQKLFKGPQFVKKHIHLKHPEEVDKMKDKALEEQYFLNYFEDPRRILPSNILLGLTPGQTPLPLPHPPKLPTPSVLPPGAQQHLLQQHKQGGQVVSLSALVSAQAAAALAGLAAQQTLSLPNPTPLPSSFGRGPGVPGRFPPGRGHPYAGAPLPDRTMNFDRGGSSFSDRGGDRGRGGLMNWRGRGDYVPRGPRGGRGGYNNGNSLLPLPHHPGQDSYFRSTPPYRSSAPSPYLPHMPPGGPPPGVSFDPRAGDERRLLDYVDLDAPSEGPALDYRSI